MGRDVGEGVRRGRRLSPTFGGLNTLLLRAFLGLAPPQALLSHLPITGGHGGPPLQLFSTISSAIAGLSVAAPLSSHVFSDEFYYIVARERGDSINPCTT